MTEIRQALIEAEIRTAQALPSDAELIHLLVLSNPHPEDDPLTQREVLLADFHGHEVSFAVPIDRLDELRSIVLSNKIGWYLLISGRDINGNQRAYALEITEDLISHLAYQLYVVLVAAKGTDFAREHLLTWETWMREPGTETRDAQG